MIDTDLKTAFLIPVRPRQGAASWDDVIWLLKGTLSSLLQQTDRRLEVIIVSSDDLELKDQYDKRFHWHLLPSIPEKPEGVLPGDHDKSWKLKYAGVIAQKLNPTYYFLLDADDRLASDLNRNILTAGQGTAVHVFDRGYEYHIGQKKAIHSCFLTQICGSTFAFSSHHFPLPKRYVWEDIQHCDPLRWAHDQVCELCEKQAVPIYRCPSDQVVYIRGTTVSLSTAVFRRGVVAQLKTFCKFMLKGHPLNSQTRKRFALN